MALTFDSVISDGKAAAIEVARKVAGCQESNPLSHHRLFEPRTPAARTPVLNHQRATNLDDPSELAYRGIEISKVMKSAADVLDPSRLRLNSTNLAAVLGRAAGHVARSRSEIQDPIAHLRLQSLEQCRQSLPVSPRPQPRAYPSRTSDELKKEGLRATTVAATVK